MSESPRYRLNAPLAVSEIIDGEAVVMNMESGHYYSARGLGGVVWEWMIAGHTADECIATLGALWPDRAVTQDVTAFVSSLVEHRLLAVRAEGTGPTAPPAVDTAAPLPYDVPQLDVFTDMKDLLLLDPIHDVGEAGWPMPATGAPVEA